MYSALLLLANCNGTGFFFNRLSEISHISNFMKIRQVGASSMRTDGQTDRQTDTTKLTLFVFLLTRLK